MTFQRARSNEQRDHRRSAILTTATAMLGEMPVADITLNELSRRVGLAKSNVLRYFESREAVLLELLSTQLDEWISALDFSNVAVGDQLQVRAERVGGLVAASLGDRPTLCDLISAQAAVLERNVSTDVVLAHKRAVQNSVREFGAKLRTVIPEADDSDIYQVIASTLLMTSGAWPRSQPTEALTAAYQADPSVGGHDFDFVGFVQQTVAFTITGLLGRK